MILMCRIELSGTMECGCAICFANALNAFPIFFSPVSPLPIRRKKLHLWRSYTDSEFFSDIAEKSKKKKGGEKVVATTDGRIWKTRKKTNIPAERTGWICCGRVILIWKPNASSFFFYTKGLRILFDVNRQPERSMKLYLPSFEFQCKIFAFTRHHFSVF